MPGIGFLSNEAVALKPTFSCPSAWLSGYEDPVVSRINMRIQDLTGLDVSTAEELQVSSQHLKLFSCPHETPPFRFPGTEQAVLTCLIPEDKVTLLAKARKNIVTNCRTWK